jgi:hypothetical protein
LALEGWSRRKVAAEFGAVCDKNNDNSDRNSDIGPIAGYDSLRTDLPTNSKFQKGAISRKSING